MKALLIICAGALLLAIAPLPIGYFTFLRIVVTIVAILVAVTEYNKGDINYWVIIFGLIAILFNPIIPVYLNNRNAWMVLDIIAAIIFAVKALIGTKNPNKTDV